MNSQNARPRRRRRRRLAMLVGVVSAAATAPGVGAHVSAPPPMQALVILRTAHLVHAAPGTHQVAGGALAASRPITGGPTVLPVIGRRAAPDGAAWLRVMLPGRPNGRTGWIAASGTVASQTDWHVVVVTAQRRVLVYRRGRLLRSMSAIVGKPATPTPRGEFFVEESVRLPPGSVGAPFALALSARSNVLQEFAGGPGQIALHGLDNVGGRLGTAVSHGCVRLADTAVTWLAEHVGPGAPVTIV